MATGEEHVSERERRLNEVIAAYLEAVEGGEDVDRRSWLDRHPEFADDLKELFAAQDKFGSLRPQRGKVKSIVCPHCASASAISAAFEKLSAGNRANALFITRASGGGAVSLTVLTSGGRSVSTFAMMACTVGPVCGAAPVSISNRTQPRE